MISHSWLALVDDLGSQDGDNNSAREKCEIPFARLLASKTGLFTLLTLCLDKTFKFDTKKAVFDKPTKFQLLSEFDEHQIHEQFEQMEDYKLHSPIFLDQDTISGLDQYSAA